MRPQASGRTLAAAGSPTAARSRADRAQRVQAAEQVPEEDDEDDRPDEAGLDEQRDVERVRPPVRLPGDGLVVDREVVEAEPEQRVAERTFGMKS